MSTRSLVLHDLIVHSMVCYRTSVQGASQGVEDGVTLAVTLALAGKGDVPLATRVFEHIR